MYFKRREYEFQTNLQRTTEYPVNSTAIFVEVKLLRLESSLGMVIIGKLSGFNAQQRAEFVQHVCPK